MRRGLLPGTQSFPHQIGILDHDLLRAEQSFDHSANSRLVRVVGFRENPRDLAKGYQADESGAFRGKRMFEQSRSHGRLFRVVLREIAHDDVGIEADHRLPPDLRTTRFISSTDTGRPGFCIIPFKCRTSLVAATTLQTPFSSSTNSSRSPAST